MIWLRAAGLALVAGMILVAGFHAGIGDVLLFKSDPASLARYFVVASTLVGLVMLVLFGLPALVVPRWRPFLRFSAVVLLITLMVFGFIASLIWGLTHWFQLGLLLGRVVDLGQVHALKVLIIAVLPVIAVGGLAAALWVVSRAVRNDTSMADRVETLGMASIGLAVLATASSFVPLPDGRAADPSGDRRNVVMIVVDRFPAWALRAYDPGAPTAAFDDLTSAAAVYRSVYTSKPFTVGYFGTLYAGRLPGDPARGNLIGRLQGEGVKVRLINSHRSAIPEGSDADVSAYSGLRSRLLGPRSIQVPRWLGLQYHYSLSAPGAYEGRFLPRLWWLANPDVGMGDPLLTHLAGELSRMSRAGGRAFILCHVNLSDFGGGVSGSPQFLNTDEPSLVAQVEKDDYRYVPSKDFNELAAYFRGVVFKQTNALAGSLKRFLKILSKIPGYEDAVVILTADHGTIYGKGRFWYGYHPTKEILNVPFLVFGAGAPMTDDRVFTTPDIAQTLLAHFGVAGPKLSDDGLSIFGDAARQTAAGLTMRSDKHAEWSLVLSRAGGADRYNLHPDAARRIESVTYAGYQESAVAVPPEAQADITARVRAWAVRFGLTAANLRAAGLE
jgi:hypothetical protein